MCEEVGCDMCGCNIHDASLQVLSFNELGMDSLMKPHKQVVVMVVSSTGEGDPPDNSARFYGHSK